MKPSHWRRLWQLSVVQLFMAVFLGVMPLYAQAPGEPSFYLGLYAGANIVSHSALISPDFFNGPGNLPADASFTTGSGFGFTGGFLVELPLARLLTIGLRAGYQSREGALTQEYRNTTDLRTQDGTPREGLVDGNIDANLGYLGLTPLVRIRPFTFPFYFLVGPTLLLPIQTTYTYTESVVTPSGLVFRDSRQSTREISKGDVPNTTTTLAATTGIGIEIPFSMRQGLMVELQYSPMLNDVSERLFSNESWRADAVSGILAFRYGFGGAPEPPPPPPPTVVAALDSADTAATAALPTFRAAAVRPDSSLSDTLTIVGGTVQATEVHALLPYIFFEEDSAVIPPRYYQVDRRGIRNFETARIPRGSTLGVYYEVLNIIGERMRDNRKANLTVTGCTSQFENDSTLAQRRAQVIADYLTSVWRIPEKRITVKSRGLPDNPSLSEVDTLEGARENQRVEIHSDDYSILAPVSLSDSVYLRPAGVIRFFLPEVDSLRTNFWSLDVQIGDSLVKGAAKGFGPPTGPVDVAIENRPDLDLRTPVQVTGSLVLQDTLFERFATYQSTPVVIRQEGTFREERNIVRGHYVDTYNLLLFSFDSSGILDFTQQSTTIMRERISPESTIRVIGHTDKIGLPPYNRALSFRRAEVAAGLLGLISTDVRGVGEKELLYDNTHPEGRYYSRTVTVIVETPIAEDANQEQAKLNGRQGTEAR